MTDTIKKLRSLALKLHNLEEGQLVDDAADVMGVAAIEIERLRAENERLREEHLRHMRIAKADAWDEGYQDHAEMIAGFARKPSNPYR